MLALRNCANLFVRAACVPMRTPIVALPPNTSVCNNFHTSSVLLRLEEDWKKLKHTITRKDDGSKGEKGVNLDLRESQFPEEDLQDRLFNGTRFKDLPIIHVLSTKNNTKMSISDAKGKIYHCWSAGCEGFKGCRKSTNIAGQAVGMKVGQKALELGIKQARVTVSSLGAGRISGIKGLTMGGLNIISITDCTKVSWYPPRPRKVRRV